MENTVQLPPHDLSAEEALLGAVLIDGNQIQYVAPLVKPSDFYHEDYGIIYQAFSDLAGTQTLID